MKLDTAVSASLLLSAASGEHEPNLTLLPRVAFSSCREPERSLRLALHTTNKTNGTRVTETHYAALTKWAYLN